MRERPGALPALEGSDRLDRQAGALGELLLGQRPRLAEAPQQLGEGGPRRGQSSSAEP